MYTKAQASCWASCRPARPRYADAMRRLAVLNLAQRIVVVVALAAALRIIWTYLAGLISTNLVGRSHDGGWFAYTPSIETPRGSGAGLGLALLAIALIAVWACASLWLLGLPEIDRPSGPDSN